MEGFWSTHQSLIHNGRGKGGNRTEGSWEQGETDSRKSQSLLRGDSLSSEKLEHLTMRDVPRTSQVPGGRMVIEGRNPLSLLEASRQRWR